MKIKDVISQLEDLKENSMASIDIDDPESIWRKDVVAINKAIEIIRMQVERDEVEMLGKVWINMEYHQQEVNRLKNSIQPNQELEEKQKAIINHYGQDEQLERLVEECSELIQAICKLKRCWGNRSCFDNYIEELADVKNLIEQLEVNNIPLKARIENSKEYKVNRELDRIRR